MRRSGKKVKGPAPAEPDRPIAKPADEQIRARAYEIYVARGRAPGHDIDDWLQAERELQREK
jgi:hypothetical protein